MTSVQAEPIVIAHRGASAYLPEHTLAAKAMAHAMNADYIEQDVVLTSDGVPIVLHDIHLEPTTDVARVFPDRGRADGHYYAIDFSLAEIRQLRVHERTEPGIDGQPVVVFEHRFPVEQALLTVPTLEEEIQLIAGMDRSRGRTTGLYIELKAPNFHLKEGQDIARAILEVLTRTGYADRTEQVFLQSFDDKVLRYLGEQLHSPLPLIQLIADSSWGEDSAVDYDYLRSDAGLAYVATYAAGIGPWLMQIYLGTDDSGQAVTDDLIARAHAHGLAVHPYTFRRDSLPRGIDSFDRLLHLFLVELQADGLFTDFPDLAREFIDRMPGG